MLYEYLYSSIHVLHLLYWTLLCSSQFNGVLQSLQHSLPRGQRWVNWGCLSPDQTSSSWFIAASTAGWDSASDRSHMPDKILIRRKTKTNFPSSLPLVIQAVGLRNQPWRDSAFSPAQLPFQQRIQSSYFIHKMLLLLEWFLILPRKWCLLTSTLRHLF